MSALRTIAGVVLLFGLPVRAQWSSSQPLNDVLHGTRVSAVVVDVQTGTIAESYGKAESAAAPGSTLKPFVLKAALDAGILEEHTTVHCRGVLVVKGHNLACVHPRDVTIIDARQALASSCNTYFATLAERMGPGTLSRALRPYGLQPSGSVATPEDRVLLALGVEGIKTTPIQLAMAYRQLALALQSQNSRSNAAVRDGLMQSVETGMAHAASVGGMAIGGKTGSVDATNGQPGHGWFAGILFRSEGPEARATQVLVIYVPGGNGYDAASLARQYFLKIQRAQR